jgi:hypothetical protein
MLLTRDLAVLEIEGSPEFGTLKFHRLRTDSTTPPVDTRVLVLGYPIEHVRRVRLPEGEGGMVIPLAQFSIVLDIAPHADAPGFDSQRHFLIQFKGTSPSPTGAKTANPGA